MKRKEGELLSRGDANPAPKKRRRTKAFQMCMMIDNMLKVSCDTNLAAFAIPKDKDGRYLGDPFLWPSLSMSPDSGADMVACDAFLSYERDINFQCDFDLSHSLNNASKGALRTPLAVETSGPALFGDRIG